MPSTSVLQPPTLPGLSHVSPHARHTPVEDRLCTDQILPPSGADVVQMAFRVTIPFGLSAQNSAMERTSILT